MPSFRLLHNLPQGCVGRPGGCDPLLTAEPYDVEANPPSRWMVCLLLTPPAVENAEVVKIRLRACLPPTLRARPARLYTHSLERISGDTPYFKDVSVEP